MPRNALLSEMDFGLVTAALDSISAHVAILDGVGTTIYVNHAWRQFADQNGYQGTSYGLGLNYIGLAGGCTGANCREAHRTAEGIRAGRGSHLWPEAVDVCLSLIERHGEDLFTRPPILS